MNYQYTGCKKTVFISSVFRCWDEMYIYIYCCDVMIMGKYQCIYSLTSKPALECKLCLTRLAWWEKIKTYVGFFDVFFFIILFFPPWKGVAARLLFTQLYSGRPWERGELHWLLQRRRQAVSHFRCRWPVGKDLGLPGMCSALCSLLYRLCHSKIMKL